MLAGSGRTRRVLGVVTASTFTLGLGAVAGVVPRVGDVTTVRVADASPFNVEEALVQPFETGTSSTVVTVPVAEPAQPTEPKPQPVVPPAPAPPAPRSPVEQAPDVDAEPVIDVLAPAPAPATVPRRQPSAAEIERAIAGLRPFVRSLFPINPTHAQVGELGDNICTAFDDGQTVDQVKATGAQLVKKVPFATLLPGGDAYIIRTGVALYCPGHASKLA